MLMSSILCVLNRLFPFAACWLTRLLPLLLCAHAASYASESVPATPDALVLTEGQSHYFAGKYLRLLEDKTRILSADQAWSDEFNGRYETSGVDIPNQGITASTFWAKLKLQNNTRHQDVWYLGLADAMVQHVDLYQRQPEGTLVVSRSGSLVPGSEKQRHDRSPSFKLLLPPGQSQEILLRIRTDYASVMPISIATPVAYARAQQDESILHGIFLGTTFALMVYNLFVYWATREKINLIYVVFLFSNTLNAMALNGSLQQRLPEHPELVNLVFMLSYNATMTISAIYARAFLNPDSRLLTWLQYLLMAASVSAIAAFAAGNGNAWATITTSTAFLGSVFVLSFAFQRALRGELAAIFYSLGFGSFLIGGIVFILAIYNLFPFITTTHFAMEIGSIIEAIMLSLAMAARHRDLKLSQEQAQQQVIEKRQLAIEMINDYKEHLQQDAAARTRELVAAQQELVSRQKMAALGVMTAGIAHEINNPNNFIIAGNQNVSASLDEFRQFINSIIDETAEPTILARIEDFLGRLERDNTRISDGAHRITSIVSGLGKVSRLHEAPEGTHRIEEGLRETLRLIQARARKSIRFDIQLAEAPATNCRPAELNEAFLNILMNALRALEERQQTHDDSPAMMRVSSQWDGHAKNLTIQIQDNGYGMTPETLARVRSEASLASTSASPGMGLAIATRAIANHGGHLDIESTAGSGTTVTIRIPHEA